MKKICHSHYIEQADEYLEDISEAVIVPARDCQMCEAAHDRQYQVSQ